MSEYRLQVAIIDHLRGQQRKGNKIYPGTKPFANLFVTHLYQGRSKNEGFFLKSLGVYPGVADILAIWPDGWGFMEVKTENGVLSTPQKRFKWMCESYKIKWALIRSVQQAHDQLKAWGLKPAHEAVREPDLRTIEQKKSDAFDFYRP